MSMSNLASALHDELDDDLCAHTEGDEGYVLHDLSREHWEKMATQAAEFIRALWRSDELPEWVLSSLRSHAFGDCRVCGVAVDDPEAIHFCELPATPAAPPEREPGATSWSPLAMDRHDGGAV